MRTPLNRTPSNVDFRQGLTVQLTLYKVMQDLTRPSAFESRRINPVLFRRVLRAASGCDVAAEQGVCERQNLLQDSSMRERSSESVH